MHRKRDVFRIHHHIVPVFTSFRKILWSPLVVAAVVVVVVLLGAEALKPVAYT